MSALIGDFEKLLFLTLFSSGTVSGTDLKWMARILTGIRQI